MKNDIEKQANGISDAIVDLVERIDGPVTLAQVDREIPGFAEERSAGLRYFLDHPEGKMVFWDRMTEAGCAALRKVISGRTLAIQLVYVLPYLLENYTCTDEEWQPIVLLPAKAANLEQPKLLVRASQKYRDYCMSRAAAEGKTGYRLLTPHPVRFTADQFLMA